MGFVGLHTKLFCVLVINLAARPVRCLFDNKSTISITYIVDPFRNNKQSHMLSPLPRLNMRISDGVSVYVYIMYKYRN
jgi:hypothetical protein